MSNETNSQPGCLGVFLRLFGIGSPEKSAATFPYRVRDDFLSPAEASFYRVLVSATANRWLIFVKVRLADVFFVSRPHENQAARNRIDRKHIDFFLCDPQTLTPVLGIELDDSSHARPERQERDQLVEEVFAAASLPLLRVQVRRDYNPQALAQQIDEKTNSGSKTTSKPIAPMEMTPPKAQAGTERLCPKCGISMVIRTRKRGEGIGEQFLGCSNYPKCRETAELTK